MARKVNTSIETVVGIGGTVVATSWVFQAVLRSLDWLGRVQTVIALSPYLEILTSPPALLVELLGAVGMLYYATRLENYREAEETPRIIRAWSEPERPKRRWFWLKVALAFGLCSLVSTSVFFWMHSTLQRANVSGNVIVTSPPNAVPATALRPNQPSHEPSRQPSSRAVKNTPDHSTPGPTPTGAAVSSNTSPQLPLHTEAVHTSPLVLSSPKQINNPATVDDAHSARSIPTNLIPQDPIEAVEAVESMRKGIKETLKNKEAITFLISWSKDDITYLPFISQLLSSACRDVPRQCWFTQQGGKRDLDRPPIQGSSKRGITVHGPDADALARVLSNWFETYSTSYVPPELNGYKEQGTGYLIWIDIGPGSPWKQ